MSILTKETLNDVILLMKKAGFNLVDEENLQYNHYEELKLGIHEKDTNLFFVGNICIDHYVHFEFDKWRSQVEIFSKCRESTTNNYIANRNYSYYVTIEQLDIFKKCCQLIKDGKKKS